MSEVARIEARVDELRRGYAQLQRSIAASFLGQEEVTELLLLALFADGHALLEGAPGLGKTTLVRALATSVDLEFRRVQFTPDLMPPDILGTRILEMEDGGARHFRFEAGPIFTQVLLADEINRATPRTQSAVLEAMQEAQVSADGVTRPLPRPFVVLATQNPIELEGTFPLPEAQLDRFLMRLSLGYPSEADEDALVARGTAASAGAVDAVLKPEDVMAAAVETSRVRVHEDVRHYLVQVARATRSDPDVRLGASPRATLALHRASQTWAAMQGRDFVVPDDVKYLAVPVLAHRLIASLEARLRGRDAAAIVDTILDSLPVPVEPARR